MIFFQFRKATGRERRITVGGQSRPTNRRKPCRHRSGIGLRDRALRDPVTLQRSRDHRPSPIPTSTPHRQHYPYHIVTEFDADRKQRSEKLLRVVHGRSCRRRTLLGLVNKIIAKFFYLSFLSKHPARIDIRLSLYECLFENFCDYIEEK